MPAPNSQENGETLANPGNSARTMAITAAGTNAATARTGANSDTGGPDYGAATSKGGFMAYHVLASSNASHTATISVDDSSDDSTYNALSGATTGSITVTAGVSGIVAVTGTVNRYLRWQLALGTATSVTFVLSFHRAL